MFKELLANLIDKDAEIKLMLSQICEIVAEEEKCSWSDFILAVKPSNAEFDVKYFISKFNEAGEMRVVRQFTIPEMEEKIKKRNQ